MVDIPREDKPTLFAKRYGHARSGKMEGTNKSGYTPTSPLPHDGSAISAESWEIRQAIHAYQRKKTGGFTARELKVMGALAYFEGGLENDLKNPLHPVFRYDNWINRDSQAKHVDNIYPLGEGREGYWEVNTRSDVELNWSNARCSIGTLWFGGHWNRVYSWPRDSSTMLIYGHG
jgi:hypothetical protein